MGKCANSFAGMAVVLAVVLAASVVALAAQRPAEAAFPGGNGKIAFQSNRHVASGEVYTILPGGAATRITTSNGSADPTYSPDGSRIAYISTDYQVFVMNADGTGRRQVTNTPTAKREPAWSSDGARIAYVANSFDVDGQTDYEIWAINADGTGRQQLTNNSFPDEQPAWSPLGNKIAFVGTRPGDTDRNVYVMDADGGGQTSITPNSPPGCSSNCYQGHDDNPAWSPTGAEIAYVHGYGTLSNPLAGGGVPTIWKMSPDGGGKTKISDDPDSSAFQPAWSPNGSRIAYVSVAPGSSQDIYVMNSDGSGKSPVDTNAAKDEDPDWQPIPACTSTVNAANDPLVGTPGKDVLCGDNRNNTFNGAGGDDILLALGGNDRLVGGPGNDTLNGGPGTDTASFPGTAPIVANLATQYARGAGLDVLLGAENLAGSGANDRLTGNGVTNLLSGLAGNDVLDTRDGKSGDTIDGGTGTDTCRRDAGDTQRNCP